MHEHKDKTVILYHGDCPDGFGGAYAAWKKFGDSAEYIPLHHEAPASEGFAGAHLYFIDFTYPKEIMDEFVARAASVVVLDHHEGLEEVVKSMPEYRYDVEHSGATLAWSYFHPHTLTPKLLEYIEDDDTYHFKLHDTRAVLGYVVVHPYDFQIWDEMAAELDDPARRAKLLERANIYAEYLENLVHLAIDQAKLVSFEGYKCYFANSQRLKPLRSRIGHELAKKLPPIALVVSAHPNGFGVSIRSDGSVDVAKIAQKYGGNGHTSAAGFHIPADKPLPWKLIEDEVARD